MTKIEAIKWINEKLGSPALHDKNTYWSGVVRYGSDDGWWLSIPFSSFKQEMHILLENEKTKELRHLKIKASEILSPATKFRSKDTAADIFISASRPKKLVDTLPGGSKHNLSKYLLKEYRL